MNESAWFATLMGVALKSTVVLGAAWIAAFLLRGRSAAARHLVWTAAAAAVLALPFLSATLPVLLVPVAVALPADAGLAFEATATPHADAAIPARALAPQSARPSPWQPDWRLALMLVWIAGAAVAFAQMMLTCVRIRSLRRTACPSPGRELSLEIAQQLGIEHDV